MVIYRKLNRYIAARGADWLRSERIGRLADPMNLIRVIPAEGRALTSEVLLKEERRGDWR